MHQRRKVRFAIAQIAIIEGFIEGNPLLDAITKCFVQELSIITEILNNNIIGEAAEFVERLWQVTVKHRNHGLNVIRQQLIYHHVVIVNALLIYHRRICIG